MKRHKKKATPNIEVTPLISQAGLKLLPHICGTRKLCFLSTRINLFKERCWDTHIESNRLQGFSFNGFLGFGLLSSFSFCCHDIPLSKGFIGFHTYMVDQHFSTTFLVCMVGPQRVTLNSIRKEVDRWAKQRTLELKRKPKWWWTALKVVS